ncbi:hypothetical protein [Janthinobacterium lividum]|jgi:hypothetical protein|uniref:hypothetical protein n=1 Tax=Janthinobacterium TaxID=29580 RepID=UPI0011135918|nr:hypothetical protein [Janthinobacterium lividum]MCL6486074.1 hypothetical protein [Janthinobacterium lividum]
MRKSLSHYLAFFLFVMFMTNSGAWTGSSVRLAHEMAHIGQLDQDAGEHEHAHLGHSDDGDHDNRNNEVPSKSGHQALHAVDHLQFFPDTAFGGFSMLAADANVPPQFVTLRLPLPSYDPPFRPPCSDALTA